MHLELSSSQMHNSKHASHIPYFRRLSHFKTRISDNAGDNCAISCDILWCVLRLWQFASWIRNSAAESLWWRPVLSMASNHTTHILQSEDEITRSIWICIASDASDSETPILADPGQDANSMCSLTVLSEVLRDVTSQVWVKRIKCVLFTKRVWNLSPGRWGMLSLWPRNIVSKSITYTDLHLILVK